MQLVRARTACSTLAAEGTRQPRIVIYSAHQRLFRTSAKQLLAVSKAAVHVQQLPT
jgi:hypothetical protein